MNASGDPDLASLFAPVDIGSAVLGVLDEGRAALAGITDPVDAELWGSDVIGALTAATGDEDLAMHALAQALVPAAERAADAGALAVLRVFAVLGSAGLRARASEAAQRIAACGVPDPAWAAQLGAPVIAECWHYADVGGRQESLTLTFGYASLQHAVSVLIDHGLGGKIRDSWVSKGADQMLTAELTAGGDPLVLFEELDADQAVARLGQAVAAGECPGQPDQVDDVAAHRALLRARLNHAAR